MNVYRSEYPFCFRRASLYEHQVLWRIDPVQKVRLNPELDIAHFTTLIKQPWSEMAVFNKLSIYSGRPYSLNWSTECFSLPASSSR